LPNCSCKPGEITHWTFIEFLCSWIRFAHFELTLDRFWNYRLCLIGLQAY